METGGDKTTGDGGNGGNGATGGNAWWIWWRWWRIRDIMMDQLL